MTDYARLNTDTVEVRLVCKSCGRTTRSIKPIKEVFDATENDTLYCSYCGFADNEHIANLRVSKSRERRLATQLSRAPKKIGKVGLPDKPPKKDKPKDKKVPG